MPRLPRQRQRLPHAAAIAREGSRRKVCSSASDENQPWQNNEDCCLDLRNTIYMASTWVIPILVAITFHEAAHAYAAWKLGDDTALRLGRVTFNPLKHVV